MSDAAADLERWVPRLLALWRAQRAVGARSGRRHGRAPARGSSARGRSPTGPPPRDRLAPDELRDVAAGVLRLSTGLTRDRALAGVPYLDDPRLLGAYLLFYWPLSYLQARGVLSELPGRPGEVLDLGSGPGPVAFAALDAGASRVIAADRGAGALRAARALAEAAGEPLATAAWDPTRPGPLARVAAGRTFDTITFGHVLNELFARGVAGGEPGGDPTSRRAALLEEAAALLRPGGSLVVIEPALRETSRGLLAVRDRLVAGSFAVRAPCLYRGPCPALLKESDWCHAERPIDPPPLVAELARAAGLRKEAVKMSYLVLAPPGEVWAPAPPGHAFRIVSEPLPSKGRLRYMGCGPEGRVGLSLQDKHLNDRTQAFDGLVRGDLVELAGVEPRGDGLRLTPDGEVRVLARAGERVDPAK